jgi:hypothetical protein
LSTLNERLLQGNYEVKELRLASPHCRPPMRRTLGRTPAARRGRTS